MDAGCVKSASGGVDMAGNGVGTEDVRCEGIDLWRAVSQEIGECDGWERVRVGVGLRVREHHFGRLEAVSDVGKE